ncbi:TetR/AcrR family transcriptional regulator [Leucobacter luti]|uniref:TetR family transcriptional regulator n=1 Tax=Leucobacter luti TaxID=340320 RepID=A0A4Q7U4K4_9MICO|nr:TetR/AcrR family transcriptional regulator [Leucobacter luti]RZT68443.1 TetR family transcriptional regulator [Leucobacter luti]
MNSTEPVPPPLRGRAREAQGNDASILQAAREVFSEYGWGAPMAEIAARAQTGVASIYRRYPSKTELVNAIRVLSLEQICELVESCAVPDPEAPAPASRVERFLRRHIVAASTPLLTTFGRYVETTGEIDALAERLRLGLEALVGADRERGLVPAHYGPADLMLTITHLRPPLAVDRQRANEIHLRQLDYVLLGLRAAAAAEAAGDTVLSGAPSSWDEWLRLNSTDAGR